MDKFYTISINNYNKQKNIAYEKTFQGQTTIKQVLKEFDLENTYIVNQNKQIVDPEKELQDIERQGILNFRSLTLTLCFNEDILPKLIKIKHYKKYGNQNVIEWSAHEPNHTIYSFFNNAQQLQTIIHKNNRITDVNLQFKDLIEIENQHEILEFCTLNENLQDDEIIVIIVSNQIKEQVGVYDAQISISESSDIINRIDQKVAIQEQILYYEKVNKTTKIQNILDNLNNNNYIALQSAKGLLNQDKTLNQYFSSDLQCKLIVVENTNPPQIIQQENDKILVNIVYYGQLLMSKQLESRIKISQITQNLKQEQKIKNQQQISYFMDNQLVKNYLQLNELEINDSKQINFEIFDCYNYYNEMETILKKALKKVSQLKQQYQNIENIPNNLLYNQVIRNSQIQQQASKFIEKKLQQSPQFDPVLVYRIVNQTLSAQFE